MGAARIFVCDDSFGYRMLIGNWCAMYDGVESVGEATNSTEMLEQLPAAQPDVVLLDLMLGDEKASRDLVDAIRAQAPGVRVVLASSMPDDVLVAETQRVGADGHCSKLASADELFRAIVG